MKCYPSWQDHRKLEGEMSTDYTGMHADIGSGRGDGRARYAHLGFSAGRPPGDDRPLHSNLEGWRIRHEREDGTEPGIGEPVYRTVVTDELGRDYEWEQHDHRDDGGGMPMLRGLLKRRL